MFYPFSKFNSLQLFPFLDLLFYLMCVSVLSVCMCVMYVSGAFGV